MNTTRAIATKNSHQEREREQVHLRLDGRLSGQVCGILVVERILLVRKAREFC